MTSEVWDAEAGKIVGECEPNLQSDGLFKRRLLSIQGAI